MAILTESLASASCVASFPASLGTGSSGVQCDRASDGASFPASLGTGSGVGRGGAELSGEQDKGSVATTTGAPPAESEHERESKTATTLERERTTPPPPARWFKLKQAVHEPRRDRGARRTWSYAITDAARPNRRGLVRCKRTVFSFGYGRLYQRLFRLHYMSRPKLYIRRISGLE